jgi:heme/copper-type cytochrome/quinol oxidase subunit 3
MNARLPLAIATPIMILLALYGLSGGGQRQGAERLQALPAVLIATGLLVASSVAYGRRRRQLLRAIKEIKPSS